ncbi:erythroblast NAD(P)(+)--arginine ADP-ribosyltransferase-like [Sardina pilchardus]|uniref:erythroblast NAD(P)(+)--arginine ADP-ribosyltransferase-like n=1 Tax=Sardina pilchardus TaxID=27697 RepID=UPI002E10E817
MMTFAVLILILTFGATCGQLFPREARAPATLDMAEMSVDDQYLSCTKKMSQLVENTYLEKERKTTKDFNAAWSKGEKWCSSNKKGNDLGEINYCIALYVYTLLDPPIYKDFNRATRGGKTQYTRKTYHWYSLHFLLTRAVQVLKDREKQRGTQCRLTYRGNGFEFVKDVQNKEIRFGSFSSSSIDQKVAKGFGAVSCFEITTCHGAYIEDYSANPAQEEVLIPSYETFKVTEISTRKTTPDLWCNTVYKLESSGIKSNLKCALAPKQA